MFVDGTCVTLSIATGGCCCASFLGQRRTTYLGIALGFLSLLLYLCFNLCQLDALNVFFWVSQIMPFFGHFCKGSDKCRMARCALNFIYSYCKDLRFQCDIVFSKSKSDGRSSIFPWTSAPPTVFTSPLFSGKLI